MENCSLLRSVCPAAACCLLPAREWNELMCALPLLCRRTVLPLYQHSALVDCLVQYDSVNVAKVVRLTGSTRDGSRALHVTPMC